MNNAGNNKKKGDYGETAAAGYLQAKGYEIAGTNYRRGSGEIDIIAKDRDCTVFVEVKYRKNLSIGLPREAVTAAKRRAFRSAVNYYIAEHRLYDTDMRIDVVEVSGAETLHIEHIENAF
jgi:putative endonuclease